MVTKGVVGSRKEFPRGCCPEEDSPEENNREENNREENNPEESNPEVNNREGNNREVDSPSHSRRGCYREVEDNLLAQT